MSELRNAHEDMFSNEELDDMKIPADFQIEYRLTRDQVKDSTPEADEARVQKIIDAKESEEEQERLVKEKEEAAIEVRDMWEREINPYLEKLIAIDPKYTFQRLLLNENNEFGNIKYSPEEFDHYFNDIGSKSLKSMNPFVTKEGSFKQNEKLRENIISHFMREESPNSVINGYKQWRAEWVYYLDRTLNKLLDSKK